MSPFRTLDIRKRSGSVSLVDTGKSKSCTSHEYWSTSITTPIQILFLLLLLSISLPIPFPFEWIGYSCILYSEGKHGNCWILHYENKIFDSDPKWHDTHSVLLRIVMSCTWFVFLLLNPHKRYFYDWFTNGMRNTMTGTTTTTTITTGVYDTRSIWYPPKTQKDHISSFTIFGILWCLFCCCCCCCCCCYCCCCCCCCSASALETVKCFGFITNDNARTGSAFHRTGGEFSRNLFEIVPR